MDIIITILIGLVVGLIAKFLMPGKDPGGIIMAIVIGIAGSLIATYGGQALGLYQPGQTAGFIGSLVGAIVFLILLRLIRRATGGPGTQA